ncbi:hypothetical protein [Melittangium boletus]|uniref:hypothetical protein n=1 Tax=Melittangium boletus TaxID=83453 RepID=UPI003DA41E83
MHPLRLTLACLLVSTRALASPEEALQSEAPPAELIESTDSGDFGLLDIVCRGTVSLTYSPGITATPRPVTSTSTGWLTGCVSATYPTLLSATFVPDTGTSVQGCLLSTPRFAQTLRWNTGQTSTYAVSSFITLQPDGSSVVVSTGQVTAGLFAGARVEQLLVLPPSALTDCLSDAGATAISGAVTLTFTPRP